MIAGSFFEIWGPWGYMVFCVVRGASRESRKIGCDARRDLTAAISQSVTKRARLRPPTTTLTACAIAGECAAVRHPARQALALGAGAPLLWLTHSRTQAASTARPRGMARSRAHPQHVGWTADRLASLLHLWPPLDACRPVDVPTR